MKNHTSTAQDVVTPKPKIEIYLLSTQAKNDSLRLETLDTYFAPSKNDLSDTALIKNDEILGYQVRIALLDNKADTSYSILLNATGRQKIEHLNIPRFWGLKYAIVIDNVPSFGAYLYFGGSSACFSWIGSFASFPRSEEGLNLYNAIPEKWWNKSRPDPRSNSKLLEAFENSNRLFIVRK